MIHTTYHVTAEAGQIERIAHEIALEQTVEVPEALITDPRIREQVVGRVMYIRPLPEVPDRFVVGSITTPTLRPASFRNCSICFTATSPSNRASGWWMLRCRRIFFPA